MRFSEFAIFTEDLASATAFYERLLGAAPSHRGDGIAIFKVGGIQVLIHKRYVASSDDVPCENHVAFAVSDVNQSISEIEARGLSVDIPPREYGWGRSAYLRDPDGHLLEIHQDPDG